jgi:hypothetical protein
MSLLHVNQISNHLTEAFSNLIDLSDQSNSTEENRKNFLLTRSLAAYSIKYHAHIDESTSAQSVTDGSNDNGIDAIYYDENEKVLFISQSKWMHDGKGEPSLGDIKKFLDGIKDLFNFQFDRFNGKIQLKQNCIQNAIRDPNTRYQIIIAYTGINDLAEPASRDLNDFLEEMNDASEMVYISIFNQRKIHASLLSNVSGQAIDLEINLKSWGRLTDPFKSYYGQVNGADIFNWWSNHRTFLFRSNIRGILGDTQVNSEITSTLDSNPSLFWYFNNGLTIICDSAEKNKVGGSNTDYGQFTCKNISIVNGAQTVSCIGKYGERKPENLENVFVPIRIISLEHADQNLAQNITKANNRQNKVENRDFVSFDPEQKRIKDELAIEGVKYSIIRSESNEQNEKAFDLTESTTALACTSNKVNIVVQLKREIGKLWEDIEKSPYKILFNSQTTGLYVYRCVIIQRNIDELINNQINTDSINKNASLLIHGNRILSMLMFSDINLNTLNNHAFDFTNTITKEFLKLSLDKYFELLALVVESEYKNAVIPTLFKNANKCNQIVETIRYL